MKRRTISLLFMLLVALVSSAKVYIPLVKSVPSSTSSGGEARIGERTSSHAPMAYLEEDTLHLQFPIPTVTSIIITNDSTEVVVLRENMNFETTSYKIPINTLTLNEQYNLSVSAYGTWWVGYFEFVPSAPVQPVQKYISAHINNPYSERNYGVYIEAGYAISGWNFGVSGVLSGNNGGTGIYGSSQLDEGFNTGGRYAGLFHGDIKTTDAIYASAYNTLADSRLNKNSKQLEDGTLDKLMQMSVFSYELEQFEVDNGIINKRLGYYNDDSGILEKEHFGLSGQEIREIYPNLVSEIQDGYLSVNYVEMVPLLIQSIQELKSELDALKSATNVQSRVPNNAVVLNQNTPNPFYERCIINSTIPQNVKNATFYLYDYNGRQLQTSLITERGNVQIAVEGSSLEAGIYLYSLVVDGNLVDVKRMIHITE